MPMKNSPIFLVLYGIGIGLILLGFLLLVPDGARSQVAYLNLAVIVGVYSLSFPLGTLWWARDSSFESEIPALSVFWFVNGAYTFLALGGLVLMGLQQVSFRFQLLYQLVLFFGVGMAFGMAWWSSGHASQVAVQESSQKAGLTELRALFAQVEDAFGLVGSGWNQELDRLRKLREDARFLSPSTKERELGLEASLDQELKGIRILLGAQDLQNQRADLVARLDKCHALMSMRKQANNRQGDPS